MLNAMRLCRQSQVTTVLASATLWLVQAGIPLWAQAAQQSPALPPSSPPAVIQAQPGRPAQPMQQNIAPQPVPAPPQASSNPGLIEEFSNMLKNSASGLSSTWKGSQQTIDGINSTAQGAAKGAADALMSTAGQTMVKGRAVCPVSGNGAPDCKAASEQLCKSKGYKSGSSVDIETSETCDPRVYISGRTGAPGECKTQNSVTRAVCQ